VPQVIIPHTPEFATYYQPLADYGAAKLVPADDDMPTRVRSACGEVLTEPGYRLAAARLRVEMAAVPSPLAAVSRLESISITGGR
jgi:UDP:flavonoid glycosyltransferase YjiC (YdhE family)